MDTPWREQAQWLGDVAAVTLGGIYSCFGDPRLPAKFIRQSGNNQLPTGLLSNLSNTAAQGWENSIPDYSLWWIMGLWNHYLYTGERRWINQFYPTALQIIRAHMHHVNEHASMAAIRWGLCDDKTAHSIVERFYLESSIDYTEAQPFFTSVVLQALDRIGCFNVAIDLPDGVERVTSPASIGPPSTSPDHEDKK